MDTNIHTVVDTLSFREANKSSKIQLDDFYLKNVKSEFTRRAEELETLIASCDDVERLQKLDANKKFSLSIATYIDMLHNHVEYITRTFDYIDETYWNGAIHYQKIIDENKFLKATVDNLQKQRDLAVNGWSAERKRWNQNRILNKVA